MFQPVEVLRAMIKRTILQDFAVTGQEADQLTEDALGCYREWARNKAAQSSAALSSGEVGALLAEAAQRSRKN
jgi:hypothetical protein